MRDWLFRHRIAAISTVFVVVPLLLMYLSGSRSKQSNPVEKGLVGVTGWAQTGVGGVVDSVGGITSGVGSLFVAARENERLANENARLLGEALAAKRVTLENRDLRLLLGLRERRSDLRMVPAQVVVRDVNPYFRVERLRVSHDGLKEGTKTPAPDMAVISDTGLIGRVTATRGSFADVMLVSDTRSRVAAQVMGTGVLGMVAGSGSKGGYQARLQVSMTEPMIQKGAAVVTSGHDRVFPRGIEIGYVVDPESRRQAGPFMEYDLSLAVDPATVDMAMIVTEIAPVDALEGFEDR